MPNRILKESINESKGLSRVTPFAQDLFKRLITYADDFGRFNADPEVMRARLYPRELEAVSEADIADALIELVGISKLRFYTNPVRDHMVFGYFPNWDSHQRIRNTRTKCPEPEAEEVNDWALRRFIPIALKEIIFQRDNFTCQECGRSFVLPGTSPKQAVRYLSHVLHVDHIVPVTQGGRATEENLRLLCCSCNLKRPKKATFEELAELAASSGESPQSAASSGYSRPESNPIQSESNPIQSNHVASPNGDKSVLAAPSQDSARDKVKVLPLKNKNVYSDEFEAFWQIYPNPQGKAAAYEKWKARLKEGVEVKQLTVAAENYRRAKLGTDPQYILHGQTFLGKTRRYEDYLNGAAPYQARAGPVSPGIRPLESLEFQEYLAREQGKR